MIAGPVRIMRLTRNSSALAEVAIALLLAAATFVSAGPWLSAYRVRDEAALLLVSAIVPVIIAAVAVGYFGARPEASYAASAAGLIVLLLAIAGGHPKNAWTDLVHGPQRLLTETLPVGGPAAMLAPALVLTWLCGALSSELASRAGWRTGARGGGLFGVALAVPVAGLAFSYAGSSGSPGLPEWPGPALLALLSVGALVRTTAVSGAVAPHDGQRVLARSRRAALAVVAAAALAVGLGLVVPALPWMSGSPASLQRSSPVTAGVVVDPVDEMAYLRDGNPLAAANTLLTLHTSSPFTGYVALAVLDDYDGAVWSFASTFKPTGGRVPQPAGASAAQSIGQQTVVQRYHLDGALPAELLPAVDRPIEVSGIEASADSGTGMLMPDTREGAGLSYTVVSTGPALTLADVPVADGLAPPVGEILPTADTAIPADSASDMATVMRFLSNLTSARPAATVPFLQAVLQVLHSDERRVDPALMARPRDPAPAKAPPKGKRTKSTSTKPVAAPRAAPHATAPATLEPGGTSLSQVINSVTVDRSATPEQFATLFAMVARYLGVPARVVTGFRIASGSGGHAVPAGTYRVTNRQAWTWVEVPVSGIGWVVADPTPDAETGVSAPPPERVQAPAPTLAPRAANAVPRSEITGGHALAKPAGPRAGQHVGIPWWGTILAIFGTLLFAALLAGPGLAGLRRWVRRRSRRSADPAELAVGAWLELLDGLSQAGMDSGAGETSHEVAERAAQCFGQDLEAPVLGVGLLAEQAVCSSAGVDPAGAMRAWDSQRALTRRIHRGLDYRQRARARMLVGSAPRYTTSGSHKGWL